MREKYFREYPLSNYIFVLAIAFVAAAEPAMAQSSGTSVGTVAETFGQVLCNAVLNAKPFGKVFSIAAYICGVLAGLRGIYYLRMHGENASQVKLAIPLMYFLGAACLMALPQAAETIITSFYTPQGSGASALSNCAPGDATVIAQGPDEMMSNFVTNIKQPMIDVCSITAMLAGLFMIVKGFIKASKHGMDPKESSVHSILTNLAFGAFLVTIGDNLNIMLTTVFGENTIANTALNWNLPSNSGISQQALDRFQRGVAASLAFCQLIGAIAFVRGWLMLKRFVEGAANVSMGAALTHIIGGCIAINIGAFLKIMDKTFGTGLLQ